MAVTTISRDGIAVITFDNPPVNGMGLAVRRGMADALAAGHGLDAGGLAFTLEKPAFIRFPFPGEPDCGAAA